MASRQVSSGAQNAGSALAIIKAQIVFLLSTLSEETYSKNEREISTLIEAHGAEANVHLIRRLIVSAQTALASSPSAPVPHPTPAPHLALRLLISFTSKLTRDPLLTHRFREAVLAGLNDTSTNSASSDAFRTMGENLSAFCDRANFNGLERLVLGLEMLRVLILPSQAGNQSTPSARSALALHQKSKEFGLSAVALIREAWGPGLEGLAGGQYSDVLGPVALSRLLDRVASDWQIDVEKGELGVWDEGTRGAPLFELEQKRNFMRALRTRVGNQVATQITLHSLDNMEFVPASSTISILHRLIPEVSCCYPELFRAILAKVGHLPSPATTPESENRICELFLDFLDLAARVGDNMGIDPSVFVRILTEHLPPGASWTNIVIQAFDNDHQSLPETWSLKLFASILVASSSASKALWAHWEHPSQQLSLLERMAFLPPDIPSIGAFHDMREVMSSSDVSGANSTVRGLAQGVQGTPWNSFDLIQTLIRLSYIDALTNIVTEMLERAVKGNPETLLVGLVMVEKPWNALHASLCARLLSIFLAGSPGHQLVFFRIWQLDRGFLLAAIRDFYAESELNIGRIVDISQDLHILNEVLELRPYRLALDAAALASRREFLELARWLSTSINRFGAPFVKETLAFVGSKVRYELRRNEMDPQPEATTMPLVAGAVAIFMKALRISHELFSADDVESFKEVRTLSLQLHPRLLNFAPGGDQEPGMAVAAFPADVEAEVDSTFKRMYETEITVDEVVRILQRSRDSGDPRRIEFYQCMLHGLMDEMRFVATYPPQELLLTAYLFGSLIQNQVVDHIPLGIAVRYVLDALKHPPSSASYRFGINALARFQTRLQEWPQLASAILAVPHLSTANPEMAQYARAVLAEPGSAEAAALTNGTVGPRPDSPPALAFSAIKGTLDASEPLEGPDEDATDKILFIINNLSPSNLSTKVADMNEKLKDEYFRWLAHYLVAQRVSIEPNNHGLYLDFLDALARPTLNKHVLQESYIKSADLLNSEKTVQSSTERTLLKNLGAWVGAVTLARNKPIKHSNIAFKELLVEGYDSGRLIAAIPFVCKILEQGSKSRVFRPPNPWLMAIVRLLVELYQFAELKLNLKFEIEVLCKSLDLDLKQVEPTQILRNRPEKADAMAQAAVAAVPVSLLREQEGQVAAGPTSRTQPVMLTGQAGFAVGLQETINAALQALPTYIAFNPGLAIFSSNPSLKRVALAAIDRAIRDIIAPVVERSVTIAGISTRELTAKDFAMEGDEEKLRQSAHLMVQNLAGSLALVTCKEPLRISILANLRTIFLQNGYAEHNLPEQAINVVTNDNLELACSVVERVAMDKAISEVDEGLAAAYGARRKHREKTTAPWESMGLVGSRYSNMLPDPLRMKLNGLLPQQMQVYEDFGNLRAASAQLDMPNRMGTPAGSEDGLHLTQDGQLHGGPLMLTVQQAVDKFNHIVGELDTALASETAVTLSQLPASSDIAVVLTQLPVLAARSLHTDETALACAQKVVQLLYRAGNDLAREAYATLLESLCSLSEKVIREVMAWLVYAEDERKFNVSVTVTLIKHHIIPLAEYEAQLAKFILREFRPTTLDFASRFAKAALEEQPPLATREQFGRVIDALLQAVRSDKATETATRFLEDLRYGQGGLAANRAEAEAQEIKEQLAVFFVQWVRIYQQSASLEKSFVEYVVQLQDHGILKGEDLSSRFFRTCTEVSIDTYIKAKAQGASMQTGIYQPVDALGTLIAFMLKYHGDGSSHKGAADAKAFYLTKVLSIVVLVLAQAHEELGVHFAVVQKPFFRLFSSILSNLHNVETHLGPAYSKVLVSMSHSINTLQPAYFPGFTFSWVALISHRLFMPKLLRDREGQAAFLRLLQSLLRLLEPHLAPGVVMSDMIRSLYSATCKIFLVLLHDFPEFLSAFHITLCDAIPTSCIQLQNIVLSAFPSDVQLADPFEADAFENADFRRTPVILTDYIAPLSHVPRLYQPIEAILSGDQPPTSIAALKSLLRTTSTEGEGPYNRKLVSSLVMTLVTSGIAALAKTAATFNRNSLSVQLYLALLDNLEPEGRYLLISAVANQLRYPNTHTDWASNLVMYTFEASQVDQSAKEITLRVILERICCQRPHPYGIVLTQIEILRRFKIEDESFMRRNDLQPLLLLLANMKSKSELN